MGNISSYMTVFNIDLKAILVVYLRISVVGVLQGDIGWVKGARVHNIYIANILYQYRDSGPVQTPNFS